MSWVTRMELFVSNLLLTLREEGEGEMRKGERVRENYPRASERAISRTSAFCNTSPVSSMINGKKGRSEGGKGEKERE